MKQKNDWQPKLWLRILLPSVLVVIWLALAGLGGPTFGKISEVSTNDQAGFLPASAESTEVNDIQSDFRTSDSIPAIIVVEKNDGEFALQDLAEFADLTAAIKDAPGVAESAEGDAPSVVGPVPSEDKQAVEYIVFLDSEGEVLREDVDTLRTTVQKNTPDGFTAYVTGPAGLLADFVAGFAGIDGILLIVALLAVFLILLVVYRAILLPFLVLLTSVFALSGSILGIYYLALWDVIKVSGQSQGILSILVIGAATDYALLFVARYREALFAVDSKWAALGRAIRGSFEPIFASAATVIVALLCLLFSDLNSNKALGPIAAFGITFAFLAAMTFLPALLAIFGRAAFWPFVPRPGNKFAKRHEEKVLAAEAKAAAKGEAPIAGLEGITGLWKRVGTLIAKKPRVTWVVTLVVLLVAAAALPTLKATGVPQTEFLLGDNIESVDGQEVLAEHFDAGTGAPVVIIASEDKYEAVMEATAEVDGVTEVTVQRDLEAVPATPAAAPSTSGAPTGAAAPPAGVTAAPVDPEAAAAAAAAARAAFLESLPPKTNADGQVLIEATIDYQSDSAEAEALVEELRTELKTVDPTVLVGGETAIALDTNVTAQNDLIKIIPIVLLVIFIILMLLLRSIVAPLVLIFTVVVSFAATLGVSALVFNNVLGFPGADASVPLFGFVFLVALGIDYIIFLMTRVREESLAIGTRPGILRGLAVTGGVITSAGIVLAATFAALAVIPLLFLVQLAFIVAFGVLLDTVLVRSLLVPAMAYDIGPKIWWPSKLAKSKKPVTKPAHSE